MNLCRNRKKNELNEQVCMNYLPLSNLMFTIIITQLFHYIIRDQLPVPHLLHFLFNSIKTNSKIASTKRPIKKIITTTKHKRHITLQRKIKSNNFLLSFKTSHTKIIPQKCKSTNEKQKYEPSKVGLAME